MNQIGTWIEAIPINHHASRPLFLQVKEGLRAWIKNGLDEGALAPGDRIPSENELGRGLGVSAITVKRALNELQREGVIQRLQGRGSFVAQRLKLVLELEHLYSLTTVVERYGMLPARRVLELLEVRANRATAYHLEIEEGAPVARLIRLRLVNDTPLALDTSYVPLRRFPGLLSDDHNHTSLYDLMAHKYGIEPVRAREFLEPVLINAYESEVLDVPVGSPGMLVERVAYDVGHTPIEFNRSVLRGDMCRFSVDMHKGGLSD